MDFYTENQTPSGQSSEPLLCCLLPEISLPEDRRWSLPKSSWDSSMYCSKSVERYLWRVRGRWDRWCSHRYWGLSSDCWAGPAVLWWSSWSSFRSLAGVLCGRQWRSETSCGLGWAHQSVSILLPLLPSESRWSWPIYLYLLAILKPTPSDRCLLDYALGKEICLLWPQLHLYSLMHVYISAVCRSDRRF